MACLTISALSLSFAAGCGDDPNAPDAFGNFEAIETVVSSQSEGELVTFIPLEGDELDAGVQVAQIDTVQLSLGRAALIAQREALVAQIASIDSEVAVLREQQRVAQHDKDRIDRLFEREAATQKQVDDIDGQLSVLQRQIASTRSRAASLRSQITAADAEVARLEDRLARAAVVNPVAGTVLTTFVEEHELVGPGSPLYRIADLTSLELRAFVSAPQLPRVSLGDEVHVSFDGPNGLESVPGTVSWVSSVAEFTPRTVQTRDERTNLVYAIKVRVDNPAGRIKIGMPGDVRLTGPDEANHNANPAL